MINAINAAVSNTNINMRGTRILFSTHTPKSLPYEEFHFQPELKDKKFSLKDFFKRMKEHYKGICEAMKPETEKVSAIKTEV